MDRGAKLYVAAVAAWAALVIMFPVWQGAGYLQDQSDPSLWHPWGSFGITRVWSPIWSPPDQPPMSLPESFVVIPAAPSDRATVRWPWQSPSRATHIEPIVWLNVWIIGAGLIALGVALRLFSFLKGRSATERVDLVSWRVALCLMTAALLVAILTVLSGGYLMELPIATGAFFVALVTGVLLGFRAYERRGTASPSA